MALVPPEREKIASGPVRSIVVSRRRIKGDGSIRRPIHLELEDVEAVVPPDDVMDLLRFDTQGEIDIRIKQPLLVIENLTHRVAVRSDDHRDAPGAVLQYSLSFRAADGKALFGWAIQA